MVPLVLLSVAVLAHCWLHEAILGVNDLMINVYFSYLVKLGFVFSLIPGMDKY